MPISSAEQQLIHAATLAGELPEKTAGVPGEEALSALVSAAAAREHPGDDNRLPKADVPLLVDSIWHEAKDLDRYPSMLAPIEPEYPSAIESITGVVILLLRIDETGSLREATVISAEPPGYFEAAALHAVEGARFSPGQRQGLAVRSQLIVKLRFTEPLQAKADPGL